MHDSNTKTEPEAKVVLLPDGSLHTVPSAARAINAAIQDVIERSCPADAEFRVELARELAGLLVSGVFARLQR